ncbi:MAG: hypothetical protein J3R72DRAFT_215087 [Linnemannia gamsii]|nr:MAG: hypothetical protein J3R72DRAFT_215087 [Linnemannia gamsii]
MRSFGPSPPCPRPLPHPRAFSSLPTYSSHIDKRPLKKARITITTTHDSSSSLQDLHLHLEQLHHQQQRQQQQQQTLLGAVPVSCPSSHLNYSNIILQYPSLPLDTCDIDWNSYSNGQLPSQHHSTSSAILVVDDITTLQGLFLYTLYFLHRLRFFRWGDTHRMRLSYRRRRASSSSSLLSSTRVVSSLSADTAGGETHAHVGASVELEQGSPSGVLDETRDTSLEAGDVAVAVGRSTATVVEPSSGGRGGGEGGARDGTEPHTTRTTTKNGDTLPSHFSSPSSSFTFASSSSSSFPSSSSSSTTPHSTPPSFPTSFFLSFMSMLPFFFSSAPSATTTTTTLPVSPQLQPLTDSDTTTTALEIPSPSSSSSSSTSSSSINNHLPPEILVQIFRCLVASHPRTLIRCTLVCHSWYKLVGPLVWKAPRVLWSQHWSRFHPITALSTIRTSSGGTCSASTAASAAYFATAAVISTTTTTTTAVTSGAGAAITTAATVTATVPRQSRSALGSSNRSSLDNNDDNVGGSNYFYRDSLDGLDLEGSRGGSNRSGESSPLSLQLQLQQILLQQTQQRQLAWLYLWQTDREKALSSDRLHDHDRQELEQWLVWKKREKTRRLRELRRRRRDRAAAAARQAQSREGINGQGLLYNRLPEEEGENDLRGRMIRNATSRTHSRSGNRVRPARRGAAPRRSRRRRMAATVPTTNMLTSDEDDGDEDDDDEDEGGSSEDSDGEDDVDVDRPMGFDSDDNDNGVLSDSDYEASDDETPLMKLVTRFDALHAWISTSATALSALQLQHVATVPALLSGNIMTPSLWRDNRALRQEQQHQPLRQQPQQHQLQLQQQQLQQQSTRLPFKGAIARIRRRQAAKERRRRLAEIRPWDGLPASLPLRTCGQWIQVINLQQEMPYHQRVMTQSFMQHPTAPVRERHGATARSRAIQLLQQQQQQQQDIAGGGGRYGILGSVFRYLTGQQQQTQGAITPAGAAVGPSELERLLSRRDFVNDWTVKTIMDHCPGLCRLTLSECHGITDRSLELIRDSACVTTRTLVSLHIAGCSQITDRGLLGLVGHTTKRTTTPTATAAATATFSRRPSYSYSSSSPSTSSSSSSMSPFPSSFVSSTPLTIPIIPPPPPHLHPHLLRLESLDFAGCYQISDKGLIPLLKECGSRLVQLRVSDCDKITSASVVALANHCPNIQWLDLCRTGVLTEECLILLAERCTELEWLNLARVSPQLESSPSTGPDSTAGDNNNNNNNNNNDNENDLGDDNIAEDGGVEIGEEGQQEEVEADDEKAFMTLTSTQLFQDDHTNMDDTDNDDNAKVKEDSITDRALALLCESCPKLQLLDLSYISTISNTAMESLSETAKSLVCLTIIGCPGITSQSLLYLARLRNNSGKLGCITMGDALGISERDIEAIMQGTLSGWQKSLVDETNLGEILGRSWDE